METNGNMLSQKEIDLCDKIGFDLEIAEAARSFSMSNIEQLVGYNDNGDEQFVSGLMISVDEANVYGILEQLWDRLENAGYKAYYVRRNFGDGNDSIGIIKTNDQFDILRVMSTNGWNQDISPTEIFDRLNHWNEEYSIKLIGADNYWVEILFENIPDNITSFADEVYKFCPDPIDQEMITVGELIGLLEETGILFLWWD